MGKSFTFRIGETDDGKAVSLNLETFVETRAVFIANSGGGKSYALRVLIERTGEKVQWIIIDPEGEYGTLREMFPNMLLVGKEGELPVDVRSANLLARKIMETRVSAIIDLYGLLDIRAEWAAGFINALVNLPRSLWSPVIVAVDEAHRLAPETPTGDKYEREMLSASRRAIITLADSGRKQSRGAVIASQRVSKLAADARAELRNRFVGLTVQDLDRDRAADDLGFTKAQARELRELDAGQFYAYGPAFSVKGIIKMRFDQAQTRHPKPGTRHLLEVPPASDSLRKLVGEMGDLPHQAQEEADTLAAAQREVVTLRQLVAQKERELKARPIQTQMQPEIRERIVEKPVLNGELHRLEAVMGQMVQTGNQLVGFGEQLVTVGNQVVTVGGQVVSAAREVSTAINRFQSAPRAPVAPAPRPAAMPARALAPRAPLAETGDFQITGPMQKILDALALFESLGLTQPHKSNVAVFSDASPKSSAFQNNLGALRTHGFVDYPGSSLVALTDAGRTRSNPPQAIATLSELHERWYSKLTQPQARILREVIAVYPQPLTKAELADRAGASVTSSAYQNNLGALRSLGVIDYRPAGSVVATALLFPEGLS